ncbi:MAG: hypothetical protein AAF986_01500 [Pseudomonadota bacterium]
MSDRNSEPRVILALSGIVFAQTVTALIWAGAAAERLTQLETKVDQTQALIERTARLEEQTDHIRQTLVRIEQKIDAGRGTP